MRYLHFLATYKTGATIGALLGLLAVFISDHSHLCELWLSFQSRESSLCDVYDNPISLIFLPLLAIALVPVLLVFAIPATDAIIANIFALGTPWLQLAISMLIFVAIGVSIQYFARKRHTPSIKQK